ncbi:poly-gamma-glutamate system protein [Myxococcota bacterium]|nr:poly-gamma-glutamate system protein [Myxococcota bacterium]
MKRLYWRPQRVSRTALVLVALASLAGLFAVETFRRKVEQPYHAEKLAAARLAQRAFAALAEERVARGLPIDPTIDPLASGLVGDQITPVTTSSGMLSAKQTSLNPNFAAVVVELLGRAGVRSGDVVAVGYSGSFPGVNVNVLAAIETLGLEPVIITSAGASQWGANLPEWLWLDMEAVLFERGVIHTRSVAASLGGIEDRARGMSSKGRAILEAAIQAHGLEYLDPSDYSDSIEKRRAIYHRHAAGRPIKAYVNVGGGTTSVGTKHGKRAYAPGLNRKLPPGPEGADSVMSRFIREGVPVIHLVKINQLATRYGLPVQPAVSPAIGEGQIYVRDQYDLWLAAATLLGILAALYAVVRSDWGIRTFVRRSGAASDGASGPEPMV